MSSSTSTQNAGNTCHICHSGPGKYVCPRCNILYCSVKCYRSGGHADCSEEFYRKCVQEELATSASETSNPESMLQILQRLQQAGGQELNLGEEDDEEEEEEEEEVDSDDDTETTDDLAARLAGVNLDDADCVWQKLTREERQEFQRILSSGDTSAIVPEWQPWWTYKIAKKLVEDLDATVDLNFMKTCPELNDNVPPLPDPSKAHPAVLHCIENTVLGYVVMARHYAGDYLTPELCLEAAVMLLQLSSSLGKGENFLDHETAVAAVSLVAMQDAGVTEESMLQAKQDLQCIMQGPGAELATFYLHSALSDCIRLLVTAQQNTAKEDKSTKGEFSQKFSQSDASAKKMSKKQVTLASKKLEFFIAWTLARKSLNKQ